MTKALAEAIARRPPRGNGTGEAGANFSLAVTVASSSAQTIPQVKGGSGAFFTFVCSEDCCIRFGGANISSATAFDYLMRAGQSEEWWCEANEDLFFCVIRAGATDGSLDWYRSSR
jgi:hypothetical protein